MVETTRKSSPDRHEFSGRHDFVLVARFPNDLSVQADINGTRELIRASTLTCRILNHKIEQSGQMLNAREVPGGGRQSDFTFVVVTGATPPDDVIESMKNRLNLKGQLMTISPEVIESVLNGNISAIAYTDEMPMHGSAGPNNRASGADYVMPDNIKDIKTKVVLSPRARKLARKASYERRQPKSARELRHRPPDRVINRLNKQVERWNGRIARGEPI